MVIITPRRPFPPLQTGKSKIPRLTTAKWDQYGIVGTGNLLLVCSATCGS